MKKIRIKDTQQLHATMRRVQDTSEQSRAAKKLLSMLLKSKNKKVKDSKDDNENLLGSCSKKGF